MTTVAKSSLLIGLIVLSGVSLSACNRESGDDAPESDPFAKRRTATADQFGKGFGEAYRADPNSEPVKGTAGDLPPVSYTDEPIAVE